MNLSKLGISALVSVMVVLGSYAAVTSAQEETLTVRLDKTVYQKDETLVGEVMGLDETEEATIQLVDSFGRLLAEVEQGNPIRGTVRFAFSLEVPFTIEQWVVATSSTGKQGSASFILTPPEYAWDDYHVILWGGPKEDAEDAKKYFDACRTLGIDVGMLYRGSDPSGYVANNFRYYVENVIPKGGLYLRIDEWRKIRADFEKTRDPKLLVRQPCMNDPATLDEWKKILEELIVLRRKHRPLAYNLGDEISVTSFVSPFDFCFGPHCLNQFRQWLRGTYPSLKALNEEWGTRFRGWNEVRPLSTDAIRAREFVRGKKLLNFSPWADHRTFMDTTFAGVLGELVSHCKGLDPLIPAGMEGGQAPSAFGGYDWWKLMQVTQWQEPYDVGESREVIRSFNLARLERMPVAATLFSRKTAAEAKLGMYQVWRLFTHGDRGIIIWHDKSYFENEYEPTDYAKAMADTFFELRSGLGKLFAHPGFRMEPDPIAIYYSQPSIQAHWMLDSRQAGPNWIKRGGPYERRHSTLIKDRRAWVRLLEDIGFQYNFLSYQQIAEGALQEQGYRVLIMPKTIALGGAEVDAIQRFVAAGGTVIADNQVGLMDEHCKMQGGGRLDELFGISRQGYHIAEVDGVLTPIVEASLSPRPSVPRLANLLTGVDVSELKVAEADISVLRGNPLAGVAKSPAIIVNDSGRGRAVYLNLSIMSYLEARREADQREPYQKLLTNLLDWAGLQARVRVKLDGRDMPACERILHRLGKARYLAVRANGPRRLSEEGAFQVEGLPPGEMFTIDVDLKGVRAHVYNMRKEGAEAYHQHTSYFRDTLVPWEAGLFALLPYRVEKVEVKGTLGENRILPFAIEVVPREPGAEAGTHVYHLSLLDGTDQEVPHYQANLVGLAGRAGGKMQIALNEPPGNYRLKARDIATGMVGYLDFTISGPGE